MVTKKAATPPDTSKRFWLSFDLGLRGRYDDLYRWLDQNHARECGDGMATFESDQSYEQLGQELKKLFKGSSARIYLVNRKRGGSFIMGSRKAAPWAGHSATELEVGTEA